MFIFSIHIRNVHFKSDPHEKPKFWCDPDLHSYPDPCFESGTDTEYNHSPPDPDSVGGARSSYRLLAFIQLSLILPSTTDSACIIFVVYPKRTFRQLRKLT